MGRLINTDSAGRQRSRLVKAVVLALRELARQTHPDDLTCDLAAFIGLTLQTIAATIDPSVTAWEKRGYWVKADKFRLEWQWAGLLAEKMRTAVLSEDWVVVASLSAQIAGKLGKVNVSEKHRLGQPWVGAYRKIH